LAGEPRSAGLLGLAVGFEDDDLEVSLGVVRLEDALDERGSRLDVGTIADFQDEPRDLRLHAFDPTGAVADDSLAEPEPGGHQGHVACRPEVQGVPLDPTIRVEALQGVLAQVDGERALRGSGAAMHGTGTSALRTAATQVGQRTQMVKHLFHSHLLAQVLEIRPGSSRGGGLPTTCRVGAFVA
jgi:hypothetical protein